MGRWPDLTTAERLELKLAPRDANGCRIWTARLTPKGYGRMKVDGRQVLAHRLAYELHVGPVPDGMELDHLCRNRACCNPSHLEPVPHAENVRRGEVYAKWATRTHCDNGHEYTPENTRYRPSGTRICRECQKAALERFRKRRTTSSAA